MNDEFKAYPTPKDLVLVPIEGDTSVVKLGTQLPGKNQIDTKYYFVVGSGLVLEGTLDELETIAGSLAEQVKEAKRELLLEGIDGDTEEYDLTDSQRKEIESMVREGRARATVEGYPESETPAILDITEKANVVNVGRTSLGGRGLV